MMRCRFWRFPLPSILLLFALPTIADAPGSVTPFNVIYLGQSKVMDVEAPRQLSLNAHVQQFLYEPLGLQIAYTGIQMADGNPKAILKLVGVRHGETINLPNSDQTLGMTLEGWSGEGRYLVVRQDSYDTPNSEVDASGDISHPVYSSIDTGIDPPRARTIALPLDGFPKDSHFITGMAFWSPQKTRLCIALSATANHPAVRVAVLYDPIHDSSRLVSLTPDQIVRGWQDERHLELLVRGGKSSTFVSHDLTTGQEAPMARPQTPAIDSTDLPSPTIPTLHLSVQHIVVPDRQEAAKIDANALFVKRSNGPKRLSALPVGLTPGNDDPQAIWSPTGRQVAYISHGDLFVTDLNIRSAAPGEKLAAGEKLTCPEERQLATSDLKQIGLGLLMYSQDYDENFPPADGVNDRIQPYLKDNSIFGFGGNHFVYKAPAKLDLASIDSPADTILGTYDTACAHIVLYVDGHVKVFPKPGYSSEGE